MGVCHDAEDIRRRDGECQFGICASTLLTLLQTVVAGPAILLLRSRTRFIATPKAKVQIDYSVMRKPIFSVLAVANVLQGLAFYLPGIYLPCKCKGTIMAKYNILMKA